MSGMKYVRVAAALALSTFAWAGCSTSTTPTPAGTTPTTMQWKSGEATTYQQTTVDTTTGQSVPSTAVTVTSTLTQSGVTEFGLANSQVEVNTYANGATTDTGYYNQSANGDLYSYDFGSIGALTNLNQMLASTGLGFSLPNLGWMLQIKMAAAQGTMWTAFDTSVTKNETVSGATIPVTLELSDHATMMADTTISVGGKSYMCKHAQHSFSIGAAGTIPFAGKITLISWDETIDSYVSADLASTVINEEHPSTITANALISATVGFSTRRFDGLLLQITAHN